MIDEILVDGCSKGGCKKLGFGEANSLARLVDKFGYCILTNYPKFLSEVNPLQIGSTMFPLVELELKKLGGIASKAFFVNFGDPNTNDQLINEAELIALISALKIAIRFDIKIIKSDSDLVVKYWSSKEWPSSSKSKKTKTRLLNECPDKLEAIIECQKLKELFISQHGGQIIKISGDDNLADFGYHK
ncbi:MAG: hypothetical protein COB67_09820 [SAR324 cluster bacterium]|uniref:RNase H type-1 domain-containing protein n=1 Tax=SAR324 cluster bacterium TaxID=2024889 RepID=A0A2A4SZK8_9DELT|nr:MAG: hypothetical protein COB67_09820 [SAR324 cluster bacterium]